MTTTFIAGRAAVTEPLPQRLVRVGLAPSTQDAHALILSGRVAVEGLVTRSVGHMVDSQDVVEVSA